MDQELTQNAFKRFMRRRGLSRAGEDGFALSPLEFRDQFSPLNDVYMHDAVTVPPRASENYLRSRGDSSMRIGTPLSSNAPGMRRTQSLDQPVQPSAARRPRRIDNEQPGKKQYRCEYCSLPFGRKHHKERHVANIHRHEKPYVCNLCGHPFHQKPNLDRHRATVHAEVNSFRCDECGLTFSRRNALRSHMQTMHEQRRHECTICRVTLNGPRELSEHMRIVHSTTTPRAPRPTG